MSTDSCYTYLVVPSVLDEPIAGKLRLVRRLHSKGVISNALRDYRENGSLWSEAGHASSEGRLQSLDTIGLADPAAAWAEMSALDLLPPLSVDLPAGA